MRSGENCRPARTSSDIALLFNRDGLGVASVRPDAAYLQSNLPPRDPNLLDFVGREEQLEDLWRWFVDRYTAVKLLSGSGGVSKTSIAWTFSDAVSRTAPAGLEKVVWLTAKKTTYAALLGDYLEIAHTAFDDFSSLLLAVLGQLGVPDEQIPESPSREDLIEECITAIGTFPCLLVVDDIDSLPKEERYDVFRTVSTIFDRVIAGGVTRARALLTARLNLGAAPGQLMKVDGLPLDAFADYVVTAAERRSTRRCRSASPGSLPSSSCTRPAAARRSSPRPSSGWWHWAIPWEVRLGNTGVPRAKRCAVLPLSAS